MNARIRFCLLLVLATSVTGYTHLGLFKGLLRETPGLRLDFTNYTDRCSQLRECLNCTTAKICLPNGSPVGTVDCALYSPKTPYCNKQDGSCTASPSAECLPSEEKFACPEDGIFPDPSSCHKFHYCVGSDETTIDCPANNVYDHEQETCKLQRKASDCVTFSCVGKEGQDTTYPKDDRIWATCAAGKAYVMGRCKDYERYDVTKKVCLRVCKVVENQPIEGVCDAYVRCAEIAPGKLEAVEFPCPPGRGFDPVTKQCTTTAKCLSSGSNKGNATSGDKEVDNGGSQVSATNGTGAQSRINSSGNNNSNNNVENGNDEVNGNLVNGNNNDNNENSGNVGSEHGGRSAISRINSSGNNNSNNNVTNGDDTVNGNLVNGNNNGNNTNTGNVGSSNRSRRSARINSSGNDNSNNNVTNGNDEVNGNLVNGNGNGNNTNTGNVGSESSGRSGLSRINSSGNDNSNNNVVNGDDHVNGNLVNGNGNSGNSNEGDVGSKSGEGRLLWRINSSGNENHNNTVANGDDQTNGNLVNGNGNSGNSNQGNVGSKDKGGRFVARINSSGNDNHNNTVANGDDHTNGNLVNGNGNSNNSNSGDVGSETENHNGNPSITIANESFNGNVVSGNNNGNEVLSDNSGSDNSNGHQSLLDIIIGLIEWIVNGVSRSEEQTKA